jgi:hypothetical protein
MRMVYQLSARAQDGHLILRKPGRGKCGML